MPRGKAAEIGDIKVNDNGYGYTKTERGWVATHQLLMERHLGRELEPGEYVSFKAGAPRHPALLENIELRRRGDKKTSNRHRLAQIDARIEELQAEREILLEEEAAKA
jgi:hypothetical protein